MKLKGSAWLKRKQINLLNKIRRLKSKKRFLKYKSKPEHRLLLDGTVERAHLEILPLIPFARFVRVQKKRQLSLKIKIKLHLNGSVLLALCSMITILQHVQFVIHQKLQLKLSLEVKLLPKLKRLKVQKRNKALSQKSLKLLNQKRQKLLKQKRRKRPNPRRLKLLDLKKVWK